MLVVPMLLSRNLAWLYLSSRSMALASIALSSMTVPTVLLSEAIIPTAPAATPAPTAATQPERVIAAAADTAARRMMFVFFMSSVSLPQAGAVSDACQV